MTCGYICHTDSCTYVLIVGFIFDMLSMFELHRDNYLDTVTFNIPSPPAVCNKEDQRAVIRTYRKPAT